MPRLSIDVLKIPDFRRLIATRMLNAFALQAQAVIVGWQVYDLTHDPLMLGFVGLAEAVPALLAALYAGHAVDVGNPKTIYRGCVAVLLLNTLILGAIAGGYVDVPPAALIPCIFVGIVVSGLARSFGIPSSFALFPMIVPKRKTQAASGWFSSAFQIAAITGPAVAGLVYGLLGAHFAWLIPVGTMLLAAISVSRLEVTPPARAFEKKPSSWQNIKEGWAFVRRSPVLLSVMALDMFAVLLGGAVAMLPAFADQVLHVGAEGLGVLRAATAIGAISTGLLLALFPIKHLTGMKLLAVVAGFGCCMIGFGLSTTFWAAFFFLFASGAFDGVSVVIRSTLMQILTPENMKGRVSSVNGMFIISSNEIGAFESGVAAHFLGLVPSIIAGGIGTLLVVAVTAKLSPGLRRAVIHQEDLPHV